jgi:glucan phosphoethanolaminetransferase (alkaline phosphatase superfamily)
MAMKFLLNCLPKTQIRLLQVMIVILTVSWISMGAMVISGGFLLLNLCIGIVPIVVGISLWRLSSKACAITKFTIGALIVLSIVMIVGPCLEKACSYQDYLRFDSLKPYAYILFLVSAFFSFGVLERYKAEFRSPMKNHAEGKIG